MTAGADEPARFLVLGGAPFGEQIVMWWNFIGRSHDEVVGFREDWQREREQAQQGEARAAGSRFGAFPEAWSTPSRRPACQPQAPLPRLTRASPHADRGARTGRGWRGDRAGRG